MVNIKLSAATAGKMLPRDYLEEGFDQYNSNVVPSSKEDRDLNNKLESWELWLIKASPGRGAGAVVHLRLSQEPVQK